ncbi:MAG: DUF305 domain-containing protein [bacterium]|nr:DUF305 domain-containing protein [bacterium]
MTRNKVIIIATIALIVGIAIGHIVGVCMMNEHRGKDKMSNVHTMSGVTTGLEGKTGDEFDKAFTTEMIVHHEGAVLMAEMALQNAKRPEIKQLAQEIISAQNREIIQMKAWLKSWYGIEVSTNSAEGAPAGSIHNLPIPIGVAAARKSLTQNLKISESDVVIMTAFEKDWSDSCLGLGGPAESCAAVITPGYEVTMQAQGRKYVYRTNKEGTIVRSEN